MGSGTKECWDKYTVNFYIDYIRRVGREMLSRILFLAMSLLTAKALLLDKKDGGYVRLLVAIDDNITTDPAVLDGIQTLFTEASSILNRATHHKLHFKEVTVALPRGWTPMVEQRGTAIERVAYRAYPHAQVRIVPSHWKSENDATPRIRAFNIRGCGHRGDHIDVPDGALREVDHTDLLRRTAISLVREWIHFRYGVIDDLGKPGSLFYPDVNCRDSKEHSGGSYTSYIEDVLALCRRVSDAMAEWNRVRHVLKGIGTVAFNVLAVRNPAAVADIVLTRQPLDELESVRLQLHCDHRSTVDPDLRVIIRVIIREELQSLGFSSPLGLPPQPTGAVLRDVIKEELESMT
ncbi:calcium-activated chloride channel regulator family member 3-like [Dermacentor andersoni]|uniref:calcium-activated chloride channel regulator family member 3-like n=1 Tax=Dermacentor andersoni TaxID=34620 RepID=UPI003B3B125D